MDSFVPILVVSTIGLIVLGLVLSSWLSSAARKKRYESLLRKYQDPEIVNRIVNKILWVGETPDQLTDSLGPPADTDEKRLKTKSKSVWKYFPRPRNSYGLRVTLENGVVIGWDEKL